MLHSFLMVVRQNPLHSSFVEYFLHSRGPVLHCRHGNCSYLTLSGLWSRLCWSAIFPLQSMSCNSQHTVKSCRYRDFLYRALTMTLVKHSREKKHRDAQMHPFNVRAGLTQPDDGKWTESLFGTRKK